MGPCSGMPFKMQLIFRIAAQDGHIANGTSIHAGLRSKLMGRGFADYDTDAKAGFVYIETDGERLIL